MPQAPKRTGIIDSSQLMGQPADHFSWMKVPHAIATQWAAWMQRDICT
jgi:hypothetical protein